MEVVERNGLYYPAELTAEAIGTSQAALVAGDATFDDLQTWGQAAWKTPHISYDSVTRFTAKVLEEHHEFRDALNAYLYPDNTAGDAEALRGDAVSELGDTVFSMTLLALNASVELEPAVRQMIAAYAAETTYIKDGKEVREQWQRTAQARINEHTPMTIAVLDELIDEGLEPELSTRVNIYKDEPQVPLSAEELAERAKWTIAYISQSINEAARQFGWGEEFAFAGDLTPTSEVRMRIAAIVGRMAAQLYLESAYIAKHALATTLSSTLQHTVQKISQRIACGRIDKIDGERTGLIT